MTATRNTIETLAFATLIVAVATFTAFVTPGLYILGMAALAIVAVIGISMAAVSSLTGGNILDAIIAGYIVQGMFEALAAVVGGLASAGE